MLRNFLLFFLLLFSEHVCAQKEWSNWYYNGNKLLTFRNGYPEIVQNFINPIPDWQTNIFHFYFWGTGGISYSDPVTGDMKFIISSRLGFDKNYKDFPNDNFIRSCPDRFSYHIIPFANDKDKFHVVQFQSATQDLATQETGLQVRCPNAIGLARSLVDLSVNNGLGDFTTTNQQISTGFSEHITLVKNKNNKDVWVVVHPINSNNFFAYSFTDAGVQPPVVSTAGPVIPAKSSSLYGYLTASHNGNMLAGTSPVVDGIMLFDFDNATGMLSNYRVLNKNGYAGNVQFSPDDSKLYYITGDGVYQYDFNQTDIASSLTRVYYDKSGNIYNLQLAPNGKIYFCNTYAFENNDYTAYVGSIECPNLAQYACNINAKAIKTEGVFFPDFVNDFVKDPKAPAVTKFDLGKDTAVCFGSYTIKAPDGWESYRWNTGETTNEITVSEAGIYYVLTGNTGFSCPTGYGYITVTDKAIKLNLGKDSLLCPKESYLLHVDNDYSNILWKNGSTVRDTLITSSFNTYVSATDKNGCITRDTISIDYKYYPKAEFGPDTTLCNQQTLTLKLEPQSNPFYKGVYSWQDGSSLDSFKVMSSGTYWGKVTYDGCTLSDTIRVGYINHESIKLGNDTSLCAGDSIKLHPATNGYGFYKWNTGENTESILVTKSGQYILSAANGTCELSDTIKITFNPIPTFKLRNDTTICPSVSIVLDPYIIGNNYLWQNGSTGRTLSASQPGLYWLKLEKDGCSYTDSMNLGNHIVPTINLGNDTSLCKGDSINLNAGTGFATYSWNTGNNTQQISVKTKGQYSVTGITMQGCKSYDTLSVFNIYETPVVHLNKDTAICFGSSKTLDAGNFNSYLWNNGNTSKSISVNQTGTYWVNVKDFNGCKGTDTSIIKKINSLPTAFLPADTSICSYDKLDLKTTISFEKYLWSTSQTSAIITISKSGSYWLTVTDKNNCAGTDSIVVVPKQCMTGFFMPTAFTPDGNGLNDDIKPFLFGNVVRYKFSIFNRWGQLVFQTNNLSDGWNGSFKGLLQDPGVYTWSCVFQLESEEPQQKKGSLTLIR